MVTVVESIKRDNICTLRTLATLAVNRKYFSVLSIRYVQSREPL